MLDNAKVQAELKDRRIADQDAFAIAGKAKPKRTFKFDPTRPKVWGDNFSDVFSVWVSNKVVSLVLVLIIHSYFFEVEKLLGWTKQYAVFYLV